MRLKVETKQLPGLFKSISVAYGPVKKNRNLYIHLVMIRFNSTKSVVAALSATVMSLSVLSGCRNKDTATLMAPAKVDVAVMDGGGSGYAGKVYSGTVDSDQSSIVSFSVPGTITKLYVKVGQKVGKGQLLAQVKSESLVDASNIAQAELEEARDAYQRMKKLHDANALPDIKWVEVQSKLKQAENAAALGRRAVGDASLHSPIAGYVSEKLSDEGQTVIAAQPVMRIVNIDDMQIAISVSEDEISDFGDDCMAAVTFDALDSLEVKGRLSRKGVVADPLTRSYTVKFGIPNPDGKILPGMIGSVKVFKDKEEGTKSRDASFILPSQAVLLASDNRQFVWMVKDGRAVRKFVTADEFSSDGVLVKNGLSRGDSVIVAGMQKVSTGTEVSATVK